MAWEFSRTKQEFREFFQEIIEENRERYKHPKEYHHLWADFWVSFCSMSYTVGHIIAVALPLWGLYEVFW